MRGSAKGEEPEVLRAWKAGQRGARIEPRYGDLSRDAREATRQALFVEQTGQCVYCGRGIDLELRNGHHIEHFRPRARYPHCELTYRNLFLSCGPHQAHGGVQPTCGNEEKAWFDENCHVEPAPEEACQRHFAFTSGGWIQGDGSPEAEKMVVVPESQSSRTHCRAISAHRAFGRRTQRRRFPLRTDCRFSRCLLDRSTSQFF